MATEQAGSSRNAERRRLWKTHKSWRTKSEPDLQPTVMPLNLRDGKSKMSLNEPCTIRSFHFEWKPSSRTIRISLDQGSRRQVRWLDLKEEVGLKAQKVESVLNADGPCLTQPIVDEGPARLETQLNETGCGTHNPTGFKDKDSEALTRDEGRESELACEYGRMDPPIVGAQSQWVELQAESPAAMQTGELSIAIRSVAWDDESEITHHERDAEAETELGLESVPAQARAVMVVTAVEAPECIP